MNLQIDVISDVVCPWCFIGKRRLEEALRQFDPRDSGMSIEVHWRPFELNPDLPVSGMDRAEYLKRKFGSGARDIYSRVSQAGRGVGIEFAFDSIARQPNTVSAHQLIWLAAKELRQDAMVETLFQAYFLEGADLTDEAVLVELAVRAGLQAAAAQDCLSDQSVRQAVVEDEHMARELGVQGVPFFVFNRKFAVSGAQEPAVLLRAIQTISRESMAAEKL
jgi:predicted DsbA family dithiol-disulfide isomerase